MASIERLKQKIDTADDLKSIVKIMKALAAVSIHQYEKNTSRLSAMQTAEKNISERLTELNMQFNQQRQTTITEELLDIVLGFEALNESGYWVSG